MAEYIVSDTDLQAVANAIRAKGGTSGQLAFPAGFISAIEAIPSGGASWETLAAGNYSVISSNPNYIIVNNYPTPLAAGETYRITWGNVTHEFETFADTGSTSYDGYVIGNPGVVGGTDDGSGIALLLYRDRTDRMVGVTTDAAGSKYLKVERKVSG